MKDCIQLGVGNQTALKSRRILFEKEFPIKIQTGNGPHATVTLSYGKNQNMLDAFLTTLAAYIIDTYERKLLKQRLQTQHDNLKPFQLQEIVEFLPDLEEEQTLCTAARAQKVKEGLSSYFKEHEKASLEGLVTFRLKRYDVLLNKVADRLLELYFMHKEYEEFIDLLRYFVHVQDRRPQLVHLVVHPCSMYAILNEDKEDITAECIADFAAPEEVCSDNFDDLLISILITLAPEKIVVHNGSMIENDTLFTTIHKVFDAVEYCTGCSLCGTVKTQCK